MARRIYKKQVRTKRTPSTPDTSAMKAFEAKRQQGLELAEKSAVFMMEKQEQQEQSIVDGFETASMQVYKNAYTIYPNNPEKYAETVAEGLQEINTSVPESKAKRTAQAKVSITGSGYNSRVQKNYADGQEKVRIQGIKNNTLTSIESAKQGLSGLFSTQDKNLSPQQRVIQAKAFKDAQIPLFNAYKQRDRLDNNGNFVYSTAERATITDAWDNRGKYALLDYAGDNITNNRKGVVDLRDSIVENKSKVMKEYDISEEDFAKTLTQMDSIIAGQTTSDDLRKMEGMQVVNAAIVKDMKIGPDGSVDNKEYDNIDEVVAVYKTLQASEAAGAYASTADRAKIATEKGKVSRAIIKQIEDGAELTDKRNLFQFKARPNVGESAVMEINSNIDKLSSSMLYKNLSKDAQDDIKANMYVDVLGGLQEAEGIELKDKDNPKAYEVAKRVATGSYYKQIEAMIGQKVYSKNPDDPQAVKMDYDNALMQYDNQVALGTIRQRLEAK